MTIDDRRIWANSEVLRHRIVLEKKGREWRKKRGFSQLAGLSSRQLFREATREQLERRKLEVA